MPLGAWKNSLYRLALPFWGIHVHGHAQSSAPAREKELHGLETIFRRHHVVGGCLQLIKNGSLGSLVTYGYKRLPDELVTADTVFRAASITKMVTAAGAMILSEQGVLDLQAPMEEYLPFPVRNPSFPDKPILVKHLLSHTSGLWDGPCYEQALHSPMPLSSIVKDPRNYLKTAPGSAFRYSNLAAGIIGSVMECAKGSSLEVLMRDMVFDQLGMKATYTLKNLPDVKKAACIYRVLPEGDGKPMYDVKKRMETADDFKEPSPEYHYLPAAGNLFTDAASLGKFVCMMARDGSPVLSEESIHNMQTPVASYGKNAPYASHCLGLVAMDDPSLHTGRLYGHQGFAYGAAEGIFYEETTRNGFVFLNSGASEARKGHLALVNRDLVHWVFDPAGGMEWM
jgi:CubicO group peptidase (beta-lactamase class C family)